MKERKAVGRTHTRIKELSVYYDPKDIFYTFMQEEYAVLLDSSLQDMHGNYSVIGLCPYDILEETDGVCRKNGEVQEEPIEACLKKMLIEGKEEAKGDIPFLSGAIGYFSYDYGKKFEAIPDEHEKSYEIPDAWFCFYEHYIIVDLKYRKMYLTTQERTGTAAQIFAELEEKIRAAAEAADKAGVPARHRGLADFQADFQKEEYKDAVDRMISHIVEGDIYIANMTQQITIQSSMKPLDVYHYLRTYHPTPFAAYLNHPDFQIVCGSMERFLQVRGQTITTIPIKGTRKRGETPEEDMAMRLELEESEKDHSELLMIVDLERNDFSRVCEPGSIRVNRMFQVDAYETVFHLSSEVEGKLPENMCCAELIPSVFPGGSITGAPKIRAMEIIEELEHHRRGLYTGSIGYFSFDGNCDLNIVIRTAVCRNGTYFAGVGGGITCESDLEFEYEETLQKAKALRESAWKGERNA